MTSTQYHQYPKMLWHPQFEPEVPDQTVATRENEAAPIVTHTLKGHPAKFPPVTVNSPEEERAWQAKGYTDGGTSDENAYETAIAAPVPQGHTPAEYPKYEYHAGPDGKLMAVLVQDPHAPPPETNEFPKWIYPDGRDPLIVQNAEQERAIMGTAANAEKPVLAQSAPEPPEPVRRERASGKPRKRLSEEHKAKLKAGREAAVARRKAHASKQESQHGSQETAMEAC